MLQAIVLAALTSAWPNTELNTVAEAKPAVSQNIEITHPVAGWPNAVLFSGRPDPMLAGSLEIANPVAAWPNTADFLRTSAPSQSSVAKK